VAMPKSDDRKPFDFEAYLKLRQAQAKFFAEEGVGAVRKVGKMVRTVNMSAIGRDRASAIRRLT